MAKTNKPVTDVLIESDVEGLEHISDSEYVWLHANVLDRMPIRIHEPLARRAGEKLAHILTSAATRCARRWTVRNTPDAPVAQRPRDVNTRQWIGSLGGFWAEYVTQPGVSSNGDYYYGPFARFVQTMSEKLLADLRTDRRLRDAPFVGTLELICKNPRKVRMWLQQGRVTQLGSNFERFLTGRLHIVSRGSLSGWQFEIDELRGSTYEITAVDPNGRKRFVEQGLSLESTLTRATVHARKIRKR